MSQGRVDALMVSPAAAVVGSHIAGINWPDIAYILTAIHVSLLIAIKLWKTFKDFRKGE